MWIPWYLLLLLFCFFFFSSYALTVYPFLVSHWQILTDWKGVGVRGVVEGSLQFMPGEESLESKCIWKRGAERPTHRITEAPQSWWRSHFPWERKWSGSPRSSSPWHSCFVFATSKAPGHSLTVFLNSRVCRAVAESLGKALKGLCLLQPRMGNHHEDVAFLVLSFRTLCLVF